MATWRNEAFPSFTQEQLRSYVRPKLPGGSSRLKRGLNFFNSKKIVTMRSHRSDTEHDVLWVRAFVQRSYGDTQRPAYVKFVNGQAVGGYCVCKIGKSGLCGHVIAMLYNLKHKTQTGSFMLFTACTSKPQTWHKKGKRRDLHIGPIKYYKVTNTISDSKRKNRRRDLPQKVSSIANQLDSKNVELHFLRTLGTSKNPSLRKGGLYSLLSHRYIGSALNDDHGYTPTPSSSNSFDHSYTTMKDTSFPAPSFVQNNKDDTTIKLYDVQQNTAPWLMLRRHQITASKVGELIGLGGEKKFREGWKSLEEEQVSGSKNFINFQRGLEFEEVARKKFVDDSGIQVTTCGIYFRAGIGGSPDGLIETSEKDWLLEIKTRSINCTGPLVKLEKYMYVQVQTQLYCTGRKYCLLMSYHPESKQAHYFVVKYDNDFFAVLLACLQSIKSQTPLDESNRWEATNAQYGELWRENCAKIPNFGSLSKLRHLLTETVKNINFIKDVNNIVFE